MRFIVSQIIKINLRIRSDLVPTNGWTSRSMKREHYGAIFGEADIYIIIYYYFKSHKLNRKCYWREAPFLSESNTNKLNKSKYTKRSIEQLSIEKKSSISCKLNYCMASGDWFISAHRCVCAFAVEIECEL